MSISNNLRTGPQETVQSMPEMMTTIFSYLQPGEVSSAERVQQSWNSMINSKDQLVWKEQCQAQGLLESSSNVENVLKDVFNNDYSPKGTGKMTDGPLSIINSYEHETNYKALGSAIQGKVVPKARFIYTYEKDPDNENIYHVTRGNNDDAEILVKTLTYSDESSAACEAVHGRMCSNYGFQRSWQDIHPRVSEFPELLPLHLFINRDGSYKQGGDKFNDLPAKAGRLFYGINAAIQAKAR